MINKEDANILIVDDIEDNRYTLERRLKTEGKYVKAKTGGLSGVSNLSGYVFSPRYGPVAFSLLMNGYRGSSQPYRSLQDAIIKQLLYG